jgi:hypothetical protein
MFYAYSDPFPHDLEPCTPWVPHTPGSLDGPDGFVAA